MRLLLPALLLFCSVPAQAFLFGGASDKRAAAGLEKLRSAFAAGDCGAVLELSPAFLREKPPAELREEGYGYIGRCYESTGAADKAISLYKLAQGLYPENLLFASRLALIYNQAGFPENAAPLFLKVLSRKSDDAAANLGLARAYAALGFLTRAKEFYSRAVILQDFLDQAVLREYALCMLRKRDWEETLFISGVGAGAAPLSPFWPLAEARVRAGQGNYDKALSAIDGALLLGSSRQLRLERALYLLLGGLPLRAIEAADAELALDGKDPLASAVKGMALYSQGKRTEAEPYFLAARCGGPFTAGIAGSFLGPHRKAAEAACEK
ncbi:MAG: tetratricopeptide repeat protein [Elusimicrobia bacterium]|nr:tetratricopeptide repeat protein [Elusimicrobiota bacterium]